MLKIKIETNNAAFRDEAARDDESAARAEMARILRDIAKSIENGADGGAAVDVNGNRTGNWEWSGIDD